MAQASGSFEISTSHHFGAWLNSVGCSLAFTTYQAARLFVVGVTDGEKISAFERTFERCMGIGVFPDRRSFILATQYQLIRFDEILPKNPDYKDWDTLYSPHQTWITGDIDVHDIAVLADGTMLFVNTSYSCIATVTPGFSFRPVWQPPFISRLAPEDRCHLNGMALENGRLRYVTMIAPSDVADGWRDRKVQGGLVWDVATGKALAEGLSMPHSPILHEGNLWLLNSGTGEFGVIDLKNGKFRAVAFCPGYARGLDIVGRYAVVGLSLPRRDSTFQGLPLERSLAERGAEPRCGLIVIDLESGDIVAWLRFEGDVVYELFDVAILPGVRNPGLIGFRTNEINRVITMDLSPP